MVGRIGYGLYRRENRLWSIRYGEKVMVYTVGVGRIGYDLYGTEKRLWSTRCGE